MEGFEPPNTRTKTWRLTTWRHPSKATKIIHHSEVGKKGKSPYS